MFYPPTCVGLRYGRARACLGVFLGTSGSLASLDRFVRSLALAIPPFKVIDIHTGRPLSLANKHLPALYPQMARELAGTDRKSVTTFDAFPRFRDFHQML